MEHPSTAHLISSCCLPHPINSPQVRYDGGTERAELLVMERVMLPRAMEAGAPWPRPSAEQVTMLGARLVQRSEQAAEEAVRDGTARSRSLQGAGKGGCGQAAGSVRPFAGC